MKTAAQRAVAAVGDVLGTPAARRRADYQALFSGPTGQRVLADLFKRCRVGNVSVACRADSGGGDPCMTFYNEGRREVALYIQSQLNMDDDEAIRLAQRRAHDGD